MLTSVMLGCGGGGSTPTNEPTTPVGGEPPVIPEPTTPAPAPTEPSVPFEPPVDNGKTYAYEADVLLTPLSIPSTRKIEKSSVWYTYGGNSNMSEFDDFGASAVFWGHMPHENLYVDNVLSGWQNDVNTLQNKGLSYMARGEFDWGWKWFIEFADEPNDHYVLDLNGNAVQMSFMGSLNYQGYTNAWVSNHSPLFVPFLKSQVDRMFESNIDYIMFDSQTSSTRTTHMNQFGGDFSPYTMEAFRYYLNDKYTTTQLSAMGIDDITTFDYGDFLKAEGYNHTTYKRDANTINGGVPLLDDFIYFNRNTLNEKMEEVFEYIREKDAEIEIGATTSLMEPRGYIYSQNLTFLAGELPMDTSTIDEMPLTIVSHLKAAEAVNKTLIYFPYPWNFASLMERNAPKHARTWIAQSYAMGAIFSIPANVWVGASGVWQPGADNYRDLYQFAANNEALFDGYLPYSKAGLVAPVMASLDNSWLNGSNEFQESIEYLLKRNINFDLIVFGDPGAPVMPTQAKLDEYDVILVDRDERYLTAEQNSLLSANSTKVKDINELSSTQLQTILDRNIAVSQNGSAINNKVSVLSRVHEDNNKPYVLQLLNRPLNTADGSTPILNNVTITIPNDYFDQIITQATIHRLDGSADVLTMTNNSAGAYEITFSDLNVWAIIELTHE